MKKVNEIVGCLVILCWIVTMFLINTNKDCCEIAIQEACEVMAEEIYEYEGWRVKE
tara:strand:+ start:86 stop:253 length:168 start_codon:yes stop_codon:yes gene_type:complete